MDWKTPVKAAVGLVLTYVGWSFLDYIKSVLAGVGAPLPSQDVVLAVVGIVAIALGIVLLTDAWSVLKGKVWPKTLGGRSGTEGITFYRTRDELPTLKDFLESARSEIFSLGFSLETVITQNRDTIKALLEKGCRMTFLILDPASDLVPKAEIAFGSASIKKAIERAVDDLENVRNSVAVDKRHLLEIRTSNLIPIHNIIVIDPSSSGAVVRVENFFYNTSSRSWYSTLIARKDQPELFDKFWNSYRFARDQSKGYSEQG